MHIQKIKDFTTARNNQLAFTLVELIVVITILAILWTIAFISLSWYSSDARDSTRISDMSSMKSSLELLQIEAWKYPLPTDWVNITYSGSIVWNQWTFWETVYTNVDVINKVPVDPVSDKKYTYSVINNRNEYELSWLIEWDTISFNPSQPSLKLGKWKNNANAWTVEATAIVTWNYNWQMTKSLSWNTCEVLSIPSIVTNDTSVTDLLQIVTEQKLVYRWFKNLPSSLMGSKFKNDGWFTFTPNKLVAYSDTWSCAALTDSSSYTARVALLKWLQDSYTWTIVQNVWEIKNIVDLVIDTNNPSTNVLDYAWNFVNNNLWWTLISGHYQSNPTPVVTSPYTATSDKTVVTDSNTWLKWQSHRDLSGDLASLNVSLCSPANAAYCAGLNIWWLSTGWRLPTCTEFASLWDDTSNFIDTNFFSYQPSMSYACTWWAWSYMFASNFMDYIIPQANAFCMAALVRCVHD